MTSWTIPIGIALIVIGMATYGLGAYEVATHQVTSAIYRPYATGEFTSYEISVGQETTLSIGSPPQSMGVVKASDLGQVTNSTLGSYAVLPVAYPSGSYGQQVYKLPPGSYYIVYFGIHLPTEKYTYIGTSLSSALIDAQYAGIGLALFGGFSLFIGIAFRNRRRIL